MAVNSKKDLPKFETLDELTAFFDRTDMGDYLESTAEAEFEVDLDHRKYLVAVDEEIADRISEISKDEHVPAGVIVNTWLREKISEITTKR